jgi:hypothetical protein
MQLRVLDMLELKSPERYATTEKGICFLQNWREVQRLLGVIPKGPMTAFESQILFAKRNSR